MIIIEKEDKIIAVISSLDRYTLKNSIDEIARGFTDSIKILASLNYNYLDKELYVVSNEYLKNTKLSPKVYNLGRVGDGV